MPYSAKDIFATRGIRTTNGSKATANNVPAQNAAAIARLERAGAVLVGKTCRCSFSLAFRWFSPSENLLLPRVRAKLFTDCSLRTHRCSCNR